MRSARAVLTVFCIPAVVVAEEADERSDKSSSSDMTPTVKCNLLGSITMLSSSPGMGGLFASREEVKPDTRVRRSEICPFHLASQIFNEFEDE